MQTVQIMADYGCYPLWWVSSEKMVGDVWVFGILEQASRTITRDISSYTLPDGLEKIVKILVGILE